MDFTWWFSESGVGFVYFFEKHLAFTPLRAVDGSGEDVFLNPRMWWALSLFLFFFSWGCNWFWFDAKCRFRPLCESMRAVSAGLTPTLTCALSYFIYLCGLSRIWSHMRVMWNQWQPPPVTNPLFSSLPRCRVRPSGWWDVWGVNGLDGRAESRSSSLLSLAFLLWIFIIIVRIALSIWIQWSWLTWMKAWKVWRSCSFLRSTAVDVVWTYLKWF